MMQKSVRRSPRSIGSVILAISMVVCAESFTFSARAALGQNAATWPPADDVKGYISFPINIHDFLHIDQSADLLIRLVDLFEKYNVRGDFYFTAPITHYFVEKRPDIIKRVRKSNMTISYHVRPPHPIYIGFNEKLEKLDSDELMRVLRDCETYRLDMTTGELLRDQPGGYKFVSEVFGRKPVALGIPARGPKLRTAARKVYRELGAKVVVEHHETGTKMDVPFEWIDGLVMRPSDFSVTRWAAPGDRPGRRGLGNFWWNMLNTPRADQYNPTTYLKKRLEAWNGTRPPLITCIIHENNFFRQRMTPFTYIFWADPQKRQPLKPPYDLNARDASMPRTQANMKQIWQAYEEVVAYSAKYLKVITSEDITKMAESAQQLDILDNVPTEKQKRKRPPRGAKRR